MKYREETKTYLKQVVDLLRDCNLLQAADESSLKLLADTYETYLVCLEDLEKNGIVIYDRKGEVKTNPSTVMQLRCVNIMLNILKDFGISTKSRSYMLKINPDGDQSPINKFLDALNDE